METEDLEIRMKSLHFNSLFFKLSACVLAGVMILAVGLSYMNIHSSQRIFSDMFSDSQEKIFGQIEERFYRFYNDLAEISQEVAGGSAVKDYLTAETADPVMEQGIVYQMQQQVADTKIQKYDNVTLLLAGINERSYMYRRTDLIRMKLSDILAYPVTAKARENPGRLVCKYMETGFTTTMEKQPVVTFCRAIADHGRTIGYIYLVLKESEMRNFYDYFLAGKSDIVVFNQENEVISTNNERYFLPGDEQLSHLLDIMAKAEKSRIYRTRRQEDGEQINYLVQQFRNTDFVIVGTVNVQRTFYEAYNLTKNIVTAMAAAGGIIVLVFVFVRRQTLPVNRLVSSMREQKRQDFGGYVKVEGTDEIRELSQTYNEMIQDLNRHIKKVVETEKAKRTVELHALQMQISPHYIYNTLASIKWLIMQGNSRNSVETIDAFIALLRNTVSNADEFITVWQEEENLRGYVKINQTRYGGKVHVEFYIEEQCMEAEVPKLSLQPFIENAFFHAFPNERYGTINVLIQRLDKQLHIEIADDGIGMTKERLDSMLSNERKKEHFTGIGIKNIDERLKLIYGSSCRVQIDSQKDCGTTVCIEIPFSVKKIP